MLNEEKSSSAGDEKPAEPTSNFVPSAPPPDQAPLVPAPELRNDGGKHSKWPFLIIAVLLLLVVGMGGYLALGKMKASPSPTPTPGQSQGGQVACTQEAKLCPDGKTYVSRQGPNCEFAACPTGTTSSSADTSTWKTYSNPKVEYTLKYPSDWTIIETENNLKILPPGGTPVYKNGPAPLDPYLNLATLKAVGRGVKPIRTASVTIGGTQTDKFYETETKGVIKAVQTPSGSFVSVTFQLPQNQTDATKIDSTFDQILSTLKFTQ